MGRQREIRDLGGVPADEGDEADVVRQAFETYRARGEVPPAIRELMREVEAATAQADELLTQFVACLGEQVARQRGRSGVLTLGLDLVGALDEARIVAAIDWEAPGVPLTWSLGDERGTFLLADSFAPPTLARLRALLAPGLTDPRR